jgi:hypothetical protein
MPRSTVGIGTDGPAARVQAPYSRDRLPDVLSEGEWTRLIRALQLSQREADVLRCAFYDERTDVMATRLNLSVAPCIHIAIDCTES